MPARKNASIRSAFDATYAARVAKPARAKRAAKTTPATTDA
jgi:hypothetical protein